MPLNQSRMISGRFDLKSSCSRLARPAQQDFLSIRDRAAGIVAALIE
jgi:hypothetical protein